MIFQTNKLLSPTLNHYGCAFTVLAAFRDKKNPWRTHEFCAAWETAIDRGYITPDMNNDGDMDDAGECEISNWQGLADFLIPGALMYLGKKKLSEADQFDDPKYWVITAWHNDRTGFTHWVRGRNKPVIFDPIEGGSVTVKEGHPMELTDDGRGGLRVFKVCA